MMVIVDEPAPAMLAGLKLTEFWLPSPDADNEMLELKPPVTVVVILTVPELLRAMLRVVGDALMEKPGVVPVTVRATVVVSTVLPEVPVTVIV